MREPAVYIMASRRNGTLYTGVTNDLVRRTWEHQEAFVRGFTSQYNVKKLVWYEVHEDPVSAITREKQIKKWNRDWKIRLIESQNRGNSGPHPTTYQSCAQVWGNLFRRHDLAPDGTGRRTHQKAE